MNTRMIRVSEENDRKLWQLLLKKKMRGTAVDPYTYVFTTVQLGLIKRSGIDFEELNPQPAREFQARKASGARRR